MSTRRRNVVAYPYDGILCRASLADTGEIPRTPPVEESPDTIPYGTRAVENPRLFFTENYDQNVAKPVVAEQQNLIYVRGRNAGELAQNGTVYVYWAPQEQRNDPSVWQRNQLLTVDGHGQFPLTDVPAGEIAVATTPFTWTPDASLGGTNAAILAVIATNEHPNPIPFLKPPFDFDAWVARQGGVGTLQTVVEKAPELPKTLFTNVRFTLTNTEGVVSFILRTNNMPLGSVVSFRSTQPDINGDPIEAAPLTVTVNPFVLLVDAQVPANFETRMIFDLTLPAEQLPTADNSISISASQMSGGTPPKPILLAQTNTQIKVPISTT